MIQTPAQSDVPRQAAQRRPAFITFILRYWLPALAWVALVLAASSDPFSAKHTADVLRVMLSWTFGHVDVRTLNQLNFLVRKSAHVSEYAILSALWFRALRVSLRDPWQLRWAVFALSISLSTAILDEWHQSFVPSRTSSPRDVALDFCGALFAQVVIWYATRRRGISLVET